MTPQVKSDSRAAKPGNSVLGRISAVSFMTPASIFIAVFLFIPAAWTLYLGFTNYKLTGITAAHPKLVGFANFQKALHDPQFVSSFKLTLLYVLSSAILGQAVLGFLLAWVLSTVKPRIRSIVELIVICAWIVPGSIVTFLWVAFLNYDNGTLNRLTGQHIFWLLHDPFLSIVVFNTWRGTAFSMLLFSAAITSIPKSHLEVARVAGATKMQQLRQIVLPSARSFIFTNLLLITLWTFNDFGPFLLTGGGPGGKTELLPIFVYNKALKYLDFSYGSAIAAIMLLMNLVLALIVIRAGRKNKS